MIDTRSASTALNKHEALQQFFTWLQRDEGEIDENPMRRVRLPKTPTNLIPIITDDDTRRLLDTCKGRTYVDVRDAAIIRMLANTGARLSEVANLGHADLDLSLDTVRFRGKGDKQRKVRLGPRTASAVSRYLRARGDHCGFGLTALWLAVRGAQPLSSNGIKLMLARRGQRARCPAARVSEVAGSHRYCALGCCDPTIGFALAETRPSMVRSLRTSPSRPGDPGCPTVPP